MKKLILIIMLCGLIFGQNQNSSKKDIQDKKRSMACWDANKIFGALHRSS